MADIKIELNPEDLNKAISEAIVKSLLGETIIKMVEEYVKSLTASYSNPVKKIIEEEVRTIILKVIDERKASIELSVKTQLTPELTAKIVSEAIAKILR